MRSDSVGDHLVPRRGHNPQTALHAAPFTLPRQDAAAPGEGLTQSPSWEVGPVPQSPAGIAAGKVTYSYPVSTNRMGQVASKMFVHFELLEEAN